MSKEQNQFAEMTGGRFLPDEGGNSRIEVHVKSFGQRLKEKLFGTAERLIEENIRNAVSLPQTPSESDHVITTRQYSKYQLFPVTYY
jgi:hypothetical protein